MLKGLSNQSLLLRIKDLVAHERKITIDILNHLKEIEFRSLHLELGYSSLFEYAVTELKYSESQAQRRISAMRLLKDMPAIETKIKEGSLNLTTASRIQSFIYQSKKENKPLSLNQKHDLIETLENKSSKECELEFLKRSPESTSLKEKERVLSEEYTEIKITLKTELKTKLAKVKSLLSHKNPNPSYAELLDIMCDLVIKQKEPIGKESSKNDSKLINKEKTNNTVLEPRPKVLQAKSEKDKAILQSEITLPLFLGKKLFGISTQPQRTAYSLRISTALENHSKNSANKQYASKKPSRYIPAPIKQEVYMRDKGCCSYLDARTKRKCTSNHLLQYDHRYPLSLGGETTVQNLRLLCFNHHKLITANVGLKYIKSL